MKSCVPREIRPTASELPGRVLVTGAAGNLGSRLCQTLLDTGHSIVGVDNFFSGLADNIAPFLCSDNFVFHKASITEPGLLPQLEQRHGPLAAVLHMAAIVSVPWSMEHPRLTMAVNHRATVGLHAAARNLGIPAFVFAGSAAEYGRELPGPATEDEAGDPQSPYGRAKYLASSHIAASGYGCSLRFFNLYGPTRALPGPYDGVVRQFMSRALAGKPLTIYGDGGQTRDFVYVDDAVRAVLLAAGLLAEARPLEGVYNVGSGRATTVLELAELVRDVSGRHSDIRFLPERAGDLRYSLADISSLERERDFVPQIRLEDGIRCTCHWIEKNAANQ